MASGINLYFTIVDISTGNANCRHQQRIAYICNVLKISAIRITDISNCEIKVNSACHTTSLSRIKLTSKTHVLKLLIQPRRLCFTRRLSVCLSLCLSVKTTDRLFMNISPEMYLWTRKKWVHVESHPPVDPDPGNFKEFFYNLSHISGKTDQILIKILT